MFSVQWPGDDANVFEQLLMINRRCRQAGTKKRNMIKEENFQANEVRAEAAGCYPTITYVFRCARTSEELDGTLKFVHVQVGRTQDPLYLVVYKEYFSMYIKAGDVTHFDICHALEKIQSTPLLKPSQKKKG